ncbi:MAG: M13-type metalloendopeptidase [Candidatus Sulfotelmatobacter sp.]
MRGNSQSSADVDGFTPEQQFFISWGQFRGDEIRPETQRMMIQIDPHPIAKYRVIGPLSNLPEFQKAWSCKTDAAMVRPGATAVRCVVRRVGIGTKFLFTLNLELTLRLWPYGWAKPLPSCALTGYPE